MPDGRKHAKAAQKAKWRACSNYELHQTAFQRFLRSDIELARPTLQINIFSHSPIINQIHSFYFQNSFSKSTVFESTTLQQLQQLHGSCSMPVFRCFPCGGVSPSSIDFPDDVGTWSWKGDRNVRAPGLAWFLRFLHFLATLTLNCKNKDNHDDMQIMTQSSPSTITNEIIYIIWVWLSMNISSCLCFMIHALMI